MVIQYIKIKLPNYLRGLKMSKSYVISMINGEIYEGIIINKYKNHIIFWDHEYHFLELKREDIDEISYV